ncbi:hypothetical protein D9M68_239550 [compost metagenome]
MGGLQAIFGLTDDRCRFGACIGRGNDDLRQVGIQSDGLAQTDGRSATQGDDAVGAGLLDHAEGVAGNIHRGVHGGVVIEADGQLAQLGGQPLSGSALLRGSQHQGA